MAIRISFRKEPSRRSNNLSDGGSVELFGKSKWWGAPDLPAGSPYPVVPMGDTPEDCEPLTFLCQIRCEDLAEVDAEGLLPHEGMLYFFAAIDYFLGLAGLILMRSASNILSTFAFYESNNYLEYS